jgi:hypothetical protein
MIAAAVCVSGCGANRNSQADKVARVFLNDLYTGNAAGACREETRGSRRLEAELGPLTSRYENSSAGPCFLNRLAVPLGKSSFYAKPVIRLTTAIGDEEKVRVGNTLFGAFNPLALEHVGTTWRVNMVPSFHDADTPELLAESYQDVTTACLVAWNTAVAHGSLQLPHLPASSTAVWATLAGRGSGPAKCAEMSIVVPSAGYCQEFLMSPSGTWSSGPCVKPPASRSLFRDVWLTTQGVAIPASAQAPDGTVPALWASAPFSPSTFIGTCHIPSSSVTNDDGLAVRAVHVGCRQAFAYIDDALLAVKSWSGALQHGGDIRASIDDGSHCVITGLASAYHFACTLGILEVSFDLHATSLAGVLPVSKRVGASSPITTSTTPSKTPANADKRYTECITNAAGNVAKMQKCAALLDG